MAGFFSKFNFGMKKTRDNFSGNIDNVLNSFEEIGDDLYDELVEVLVMSDVGVYTAEALIEELKKRVKEQNIQDPTEVRSLMKEIVSDMLGKDETIDFVTTPAVILVIGVNGVGKTTTIGKMASYFKKDGKKVILGAADTFRAAAIDQLEIWAERAGVDIVKHDEGADPAAVVFDTINAGINRNADVIICDTAGRIHNKKNLMAELGKIYRVIDRELPYSDREIFLVLDATTGQNAVSQAKEFMKVADITGIVLTKLDGTARGGIVLSIKNDLKLPVKFIGVGEGIDDMRPFSAEAFAEGLFDPISKERQEELDARLAENMNVGEFEEEAEIALEEAREEARRREEAKWEGRPAAKALHDFDENMPDEDTLSRRERKKLMKERLALEKEANLEAERIEAEKKAKREEKKQKDLERREAFERSLEEEREKREAEKRQHEENLRKQEIERAEHEAEKRRRMEEVWGEDGE